MALVRNLMYGFGDDRNPANDTVNVMEEILIEYIVDVVCTICPLSMSSYHLLTVFTHTGTDSISGGKEVPPVYR